MNRLREKIKKVKLLITKIRFNFLHFLAELFNYGLEARNSWYRLELDFIN